MPHAPIIRAENGRFLRSIESAGLLVLFLLSLVGGCGAPPTNLLPAENLEPVDNEQYELLARFVHLSDTHMLDEESPARLAALGDLSRSAWRPYEAYSTQLLDGVIRAINKRHVARQPIDFVIVTGDALDNMQRNELHWFMTCFDGGRIDPRSGPDDRTPDQRPSPLLDPHVPFMAQGLYRRGVHGDGPTIPWYAVMGNHDQFAVGILPVVTNWLGRRVSPLPLPTRTGLFFPLVLDPLGSLAFSPITPAIPIPHPELIFAQLIRPNPDRAYITDAEFVQAHVASVGDPPGHGFDGQAPNRTWYSVSPVPGLRLIALNSSTPAIEQPTLLYSEGAISAEQVGFLRTELESARQRDEIVMLATHHPASSLLFTLGTALTVETLVPLLQRFPNVALHVAGHWHVNAVLARDSYVEVVTGSTLDAPQLARIIEIWRDRAGTEPVQIRYRFISHLAEIAAPDESNTALFDDPLLPLRRTAFDLAESENR